MLKDDEEDDDYSDEVGLPVPSLFIATSSHLVMYSSPNFVGHRPPVFP